MKAKGKFISTLLIIDTFFVSFAFGFNSNHVLVIDPTLPPLAPSPPPALVEKKAEAKAVAKPAEINKAADSKHKKVEKGHPTGRGQKSEKATSGVAKKARTKN